MTGAGAASPRRRGVWGPARPVARDLLAGASVTLLLVPQSLAYAELAGLPNVHGLFAAAIPLIAASAFASCPYLQTGPVALTALLTYGALVPLAPVGGATYLGAAAMLAVIVGLTRFAIGFLKVGWVSYLMSEPVLAGFTSGAAVLIVMSQIPGALGVASGPRGPVAGFVAAMADPSSWNGLAAAMTLMTLAATLLVRRIHPLIPGALIAVVAGILFSVRFDYTGPVVGTVSALLPPVTPDLPWSMAPQLLVPGVVIALVGFAESAAIAQAFAGRERARWDPDQEFLSQGVANLVAGAFSGFPVGASFARSSLNHLSGAVTRWSGAATGVLMLLVLPFTWILAPLPKAVLSGIVIAAVVGLIRLPRLLGLWSLSKIQALVAWGTFGLCILLSPRVDEAVLLGVLLSLAIHVWRERKAAFDVALDEGVLRIDVRGVLWFASAPRLQEQILNQLSEAEDVDEVVFHLGGLGRIDLTGAMVLERILDEVGSAGIPGSVQDVPPHARRVLRNVLGPDVTEAGDGEAFHTDPIATGPDTEA